MKKLMSLLLIVVMLLSMAPMSISFANAATDEFAGGSGAASNPYLIETKTHLNNVRNYLDAHFKMIADIEFTDSDFAEGGDFYNDGQGWEPIGKETGGLSSNSSQYFKGVFDGNGYYIKNLQINSSSKNYIELGVFGHSDGIIKNLGLVDSNIHFSYNAIQLWCGGIVGINAGTITNCYNIGSNVSASSQYADLGGIVGFNLSGATVTNCYNTSIITIISSTQVDVAGGIAGNNAGIITNCYNSGNISSISHTGGIAGTNNAIIKNCHNTASVHSSSWAGGISADNSGEIVGCYNTGVVMSSDYTNGIIGGITGINWIDSSILNCYYLDNISQGVGSGDGIAIGCTTKELSQQSTFLGFDFEHSWTMDGNECYPYPELKNVKFITGHIYDNVCDADCACGHIRNDVHVYDNVCDADCNACGATRATEHSYDDGYDFECNICGAVRSISDGDLTFTLDSSKRSCSVKATNTSISGKLVIPATFNGKPVTMIDPASFEGCTNLTNVVIGNNVKFIRTGAFKGCTSLVSIIIPDGVTSISGNVFENCTNLTNVTIPDSVGVINIAAFKNCTSLTSVTIPSSVSLIGEDAFNGCSNLTEVTIPENVREIYEGAFHNCNKLTTVNFNATYCRCVNREPIFYSDKLATVNIGNNVTEIPQYAFKGCTALTSIIIPDSVTRIFADAFADCTNLTDVWYTGTENQKETIKIYNNLQSATWHYNTCKTAHTYLTDCDTTCNSCEWRRIANGQHIYEDAHDAESHFEKCVCGEIINKEAHEYDNNCDSDCDICGMVRLVPEHVYSNACDIDCNICSTVRVASDHVYTNACDIDCNSCGTMRSTTHSYGKYVYNNDATTKKDGTKTRTCSVCGDKQTVTAKGTKLQSTKPFTDVKKSDFYYEPVLWAVNNGITAGATKTTFEPNSACTRGQIATFLWRAAGQPTPSTSKNPFTDVKKSDYYYKAVLWAVGAGITSGTSKTTFSPNDPCTRGQIAAFLWRANGGKKVNASNPFTDVKKSDYYYNAVLWAVKNGITAGATKTTFEPNSPCTRGQIATFLYRAYN